MDTPRFELTKNYIPVYIRNRMSDKINKITPLGFFSWKLNAKTRFSISPKGRFFKVFQMWFWLGELYKIARNGFLHVKPSKKIYGRKLFWLPRLITWPEISHRKCSKLPKKTFFANYRWTGNHWKKNKNFHRYKFG
jgi:hypothetical protein